MINIQSVSHSIQGQTILSDISLSLPKGKLSALIGPNGAGKSTLLSLIARLHALQHGVITVDGLDVSKTPSRTLARKLAILSQSNTLASRLTVRDLVSFGRFPHHNGRPGAEDKNKVDEAIAALGLGEIAHRFLDEISGGQRQKAFVAMAYAQDTDYLLLDEPLNNLDMKSARALMQTLHELSEQSGKTIVVVLHEINYAALYADWIVGLRDGKLIANGPTHDILTSETIETIFDFEAEIHQIGDQKLVMHYR
ncbi:ABC transporter ATP-binding protein [Cohaesibacter haloalkalitolerans]|uniref:iron ABC transporter ATP-binding protein n=1 Tax=Cohaesibacter haloalkalitolerans TaxID=1162980 RepID=UPI000E659896|nr:ATP-binding cassette domain-containing protein [Cohaesibacter haloalkalitolerans]